MNGTNPLAGLRPGPPPRELRAHVLAAAAEARATAAARTHWIDRAWESRALWAAWSLAVLVSLASYFGAEKSAESTAMRYGWVDIVSVSDRLSELHRWAALR